MPVCLKNTITRGQQFSRNFEYVPCNLCTGNDYRVLFEQTLTVDDFEHNDEQYSISQKSPHHGQIVQCRRCGLVYSNPREKSKDIILNYTMVKDHRYVVEQEARIRTFARGLRLLDRYCPGKGTLLDLGCFVGMFPTLARSNGWSVMGIEPSHWAAEYAKDNFNLDIARGTFEDFTFADESFDLITMWDVIEHLSDPKSTLLALHKTLKKQGILFCNTFNYDSFFRKIFNERYWCIERMHIYYFSIRTMREMLEACNYEVLKIVPHFKTLSLEYFISRLKGECRFLGSFIDSLHSLSNLKRFNITVYAGQMSIIAKKKR